MPLSIPFLSGIRVRIYRFCLFMLGDEAEASDIYQEVFIRFYRACREGQQMHNVHGYLITAARTRCISVLRTSHRLTTLDDTIELGYEPDETAYDTNTHLQQALLKIPSAVPRNVPSV